MLIPASTTRYWRRELQATDLAWGAFGENFTTEGLLEPDIRIGDRIRVGSAEFLVTQPRMPCFKLGVRFGRDDMVKRFLRSGRPGFYLAVVREGEVARGNSLEFVGRDEHGVTVADIASLYARDRDNEDLSAAPSMCPRYRKAGRDILESVCSSPMCDDTLPSRPRRVAPGDR